MFVSISISEYRQRTQRRRFLLYNLYSWGVPSLVTTATLAIHLLQPATITNPGFGRDTCFFSTYLARLLYLHGIIAAILATNLALFLASAYQLLFGIWAAGSGAAEAGARRRRARGMLGVVAELFLVLGLTWLAEVASLVANWRAGALYSGWEVVVFDIINSLQGVLIFLVLVCKPRMRTKIRAALLDLVPSLHCSKPQQDTTMVSTLLFVLFMSQNRSAIGPDFRHSPPSSLCCRQCTRCRPRRGPRG